MVDQRDKGSESEDMYSETPDRVSSEGSKIKTCADCGTSKTPLWRGGPAGPKSLCNACGIKSRKKRRAILGVSKGSTEDKKSKKISISSSKQSSSSCSSISSTSRNSGSNSSSKLGKSLKKKLVPLGREVVLQRSVADNKFRSKLGEEEQAAMLLMALSCGSVYA